MGHLREQHAGLQYKCLKCRKLFRRNDNPHICRARRDEYVPFVMATGETGDAAMAVLDKFMTVAERNQVKEKRVSLTEEEYREKFGNVKCATSIGRGRPLVRKPVNPVDFTQRKRTQPSLPYNGKYRRVSPVSSNRSSSTSSSSSSSSSSSTTSSSSSSSTQSFALDLCMTPNLSEAEERLNEIGVNSSSLNSYEEMTGCEEPFMGEEQDERRVVQKKMRKRKEKRVKRK